MHQQLELLLQLQDLRAQRNELAQDRGEREVQQEHFDLDIEEAVQELDSKIQDVKESLDPDIRSRYERVARGRSRAMVPVINGVCYGCFVQTPTAVAAEKSRGGQDEIVTCENCGRFLYFVV